MGTPTYGRQWKNLPPQGTPAGAYSGAGSVPQGDQTADALMRTADAMVDVYRKERDDAKVLRKQLQDAIDEGYRTQRVLLRLGPKDFAYVSDCSLSELAETALNAIRSAHVRAVRERDEARQSGVLMAGERDELAARLNEAEELLRKQCLVNPEDISLPEMMGKAHRAYIVFENRDGSGTKVLLKDNFARGWNGTTTRVIDFHAPDTRPEQPIKLQDLRCPCGGSVEFEPSRVGRCMTCGATCRVLEQPKAEPVAMAPPDTCDQTLGEALAEAYRNLSKWRKRAQWCQEALRNIRSMTGNMSFQLDEDWGNDDK